MSSYSYKALDAQGQKDNGVIEAATMAEAITALHGRSLSILNIEQRVPTYNPFKLLKKMGRHRSPKTIHKSNFLRQLAMMIRGGHTLTEGLVLSAEMTDRKPLQDAIVDMLIRVQQGGDTFSGAVAAQGSMFPPYVSKLLGAGEQSGELADTLERLADHMEVDSDVRIQFANSLIYPGLLMLVATAVFIGLSVYIVPKFAVMLEGRSENLPAVSQAMIDISQWVIEYGLFTAGLIVLGTIAISMMYRMGAGKSFFDDILINTPFIGTNIRNTAMSQMGWTMSMLINSGQSVIESLEFMARITNNKHLSDSFSQARQSIIDGQNLGYGLRQPHIPMIVQHMTSVGEQSGELVTALKGLGEHYQRESDARIKTMMAFMEPALILLVAGMVAFIYIGFFKAMMHINQIG